MKFIYKYRKLLFFLLLVLLLNWWTYPTIRSSGTTKIYDRNGILLYEAAGSIGRKANITYNQLPDSLINATIITEDKTFWSNSGVDFGAILRALYGNLRKRAIVSGGSTITQQLARTVVIGGNAMSSRTWTRKVQEILIAWRLNSTLTKKQILTMYLNEVYYGNHAVGVQSASQYYFAKDASQLSIAESALLAGLVASPTAYDPFIHLEAAISRQKYILSLMLDAKMIKLDQYERALRQRLVFQVKPWEIKAPYFVDYVLQQLEEQKYSTSQGLNVYTTLDYPVYDLSQEIARRWITQLKNEHNLSNAALVLLDNRTGEIINLLGGIDYFDASHSGQVNVATSLRQPGSTLKPITYAAAFMHGNTPATLIYDVPTIYKTKKGEGYAPNNYDGKFHGLVLAREALASSLNLPAVEMLHRIGMPTFLDLATQMGISSFNDRERYDLSITLGGGEVALLDLTNAYATLARRGNYLHPFAIKKITNLHNTVLYQHQVEPTRQVMGPQSEQISYLISDILSDPKARIPGFGEKNPLVLSRPAAVKTGTTTDWHDNWTVGYTPSYTVGVWVGNNDNQAMKKISGVVGAAPIWHQFFEEYLKGKPVENFVRPDGIVDVEVCKLDGLIPNPLCTQRLREKFIVNTEPKKTSNLYKMIELDSRNNLLAGKDCPIEVIVKKTLVDYPAAVYSWAQATEQEVIPRSHSDLCRSHESTSNGDYLAITHPKPGSVFTYAPSYIVNQGVVLSVSVSASVTSVTWYVDDKLFQSTSVYPFSVSLLPTVGKHTVKAVGKTQQGVQLFTEVSAFKMVADPSQK